MPSSNVNTLLDGVAVVLGFDAASGGDFGLVGSLEVLASLRHPRIEETMSAMERTVR